MMVESLISGLNDIASSKIPIECIYDLAPEIVEAFNMLISQQNHASFSGLDFVFIAGKVTGLHRQQTFNLFKNAEQYLHAKGFKTINPLSLAPPICTWSYAMRISLNYMVNHCNKLYLLDNWEDSKGARIQKSLADTLGFSIMQFSASL